MKDLTDEQREIQRLDEADRKMRSLTGIVGRACDEFFRRRKMTSSTWAKQRDARVEKMKGAI
jgi:hypothetical protein